MEGVIRILDVALVLLVVSDEAPQGMLLNLSQSQIRVDAQIEYLPNQEFLLCQHRLHDLLFDPAFLGLFIHFARSVCRS